MMALRRSREHLASAATEAHDEYESACCLPPEELVAHLREQRPVRVREARRRMKEQGYDALVVVSTPGILSNDGEYLSGEDGAQLHVLTAKTHYALPLGKSLDARTVRESTVRAFEKAEEKEGWTGDIKIGVEGNVSGEIYAQIQRATQPEGILEPSSVIGTLRREKIPEEVALMEQGQAYVDRILQERFPELVYEGITEAQLASALKKELTREFPASFDPIVAFGENTADPHATPGSRALKPGEPILIDCGIRYHGYCTDTTRMYWFGEKPEEEFESVYNLLRSAQEQISEDMRAGLPTAEVDARARELLSRDGADYARYFVHSLGHGVGLYIHERPNLSTLSKDMLEVGDVVTNEPGIYIPGKWGMRLEDMIAIAKKGKGGARVLSRNERGLIRLPIRQRPEGAAVSEKDAESTPPLAPEKLYRLMEKRGVQAYVVAKTEHSESDALLTHLGFRATDGTYIVLNNVANGSEEGSSRSEKFPSYRRFFIADGRYARRARKMCDELGIEFIEITPDLSKAQAIRSVLERWMPPDEEDEWGDGSRPKALGIESGATEAVERLVHDAIPKVQGAPRAKHVSFTKTLT